MIISYKKKNPGKRESTPPPEKRIEKIEDYDDDEVEQESKDKVENLDDLMPVKHKLKDPRERNPDDEEAELREMERKKQEKEL